jgi:PAS domain S-box-containing protein
MATVTARLRWVLLRIKICGFYWGASAIRMTGDWLSRFRRIVLECCLGGAALATVILISFRLNLGLETTALLSLVAIGLLSLKVHLTSSVIITIFATLLIEYYLSAPTSLFEGNPTRNIMLGVIFLLLMLGLSWLVMRGRGQITALREREAHWKEIFEQDPTMHFLIDADGIVLAVNQFGASQLGHVVSELVGEPVHGLFHEADRELVQSNLAACRETPGRSRVWEVRKRRKDGSTVWVRENAKFVQWGANAPVFLVSCEDITERRIAEQAVRRSQDNLLEAQRLGRMGSWSVDVSSGVNGAVTASPEMLRIFGLDPEKDELTQDLLVERIHPDDRVFINTVREGRLTARADYEYDYRIVLPDGAIRHLHSISHPVVGDDGALLEHVGTTLDMTERKEAEEALRQAYADLARVSRITSIGALTASLAHEINQPIAAAVTNANACLRWLDADAPDLEEVRAAAAAIVRNGTRAAEIIARTRRLFEKGAPQREAIEVDDLVRETVVLLSGETSRHSVSIRTSLAAGLPEVQADRVQLQQVLMNLILNGIDAMEEVDGGREITIVSKMTGDKEIVVSVGDTGVGLPAELADQLFDTFFTTKPHGTGMGLSISRSIIAAHGGRLWAEPNEPRGAVFRFTLPTVSEPVTT